MNYASKILKLKIYHDKYFSLKWNILAESLSYANSWHKEASCVYADAEMWVYIINDLSCHGELRLVLKAIPCHKSTFYNAWMQGTVSVHSKLKSVEKMSLPLTFQYNTFIYGILHSTWCYLWKSMQGIVPIDWIIVCTPELKDISHG